MTETHEFVVPKSIPITSELTGFELNALAAAAHLCVNGVPCDAFRRLEVCGRTEVTAETKDLDLDLAILERSTEPIAIEEESRGWKRMGAEGGGVCFLRAKRSNIKP